MADFVHLHLHTLYSLLDGAIRMKDLVKNVSEKKMSAVAVTDHGNMFGAVDFYKKAKDAGIKPILGCETYVAGPRGRTDRSERVSNHLVLLAENQEGWRNLRYLVSKGYTEGHYYHPRIDKELLARHSKGIIGLTACLGGEIPGLARRGDMDGARRAAEEYKNIFEPGRFFLEIQCNGLPEQEKANAELKQLSRDLDIPLAATADAHYVKREDAKAHELLMCIAQGKLYDDPKRMRHDTEELYIKSPDEMMAHFTDVPEAVHNTVRIGEMCNVELELGKVFLPNFQVPDGYDNDSYMAHLSRTGLDRRFQELAKQYPVDRDAYRQRLEMEISVIQKMGFSGYFLIVQDFINWAKEHGIPVGPGRGSGAGSIVAYALRITDLDPIPYALLFERFLNPERVSMPDFDVDFCQNRRGEVIKYVTRKYGEEQVGQIITFGQLSAKSAIKDVGRVLGLSFGECNELTKNIPNLVDGHPPTIEKAIELDPKLQERIDSDPRIAEVFRIAKALQGLNRQAGMHAAGVVIADKPLWEYVPLYQPAGENFLVTQFAKDEVEQAGLVKFDFLGLKTLTVIRDAIDMINANHPELPTKLVEELIPLDDAPTYQMIAKGDTQGVFQLESSGFTELLKKLKPDRFEDIVAAVALYRPGPLQSGMVDDFIERKHGRQAVSYPHPDLEPILKPTYGVIVYQEQVMQISQVLGGYSLGRADLLRRAMGKKKPEVMAKERVGFMEGAKVTGVDPKLAGEIFDLMEKFAAYGFNKCVVGSTEVIDARTGARHTVADLYEKRRAFETLSLHEPSGKIVARPVTDVMQNGVKPVFALTTALGKRVIATGNHPFLTKRGWKWLEELKAGDEIATPRTLPLEKGASWPRHQLVAAAALFTGTTVREGSAARVRMASEALAADLAQVVRQFPLTAAQVEGAEVRLSPPQPFVPASGGATAWQHTNESSCFATWAKALDLFEGRRLPAEVFTLRDADLELLLGRIWSACGTLSSTPSLKVASEAGAHDVQHLLSRLGIVSAVRASGAAWSVRIASAASVERFHSCIAPHLVGRDAERAALREALLARGRTAVESDVYWDEVASIEPRGEEMTYDLTVDETHNFVADGVIVHNSHSAAYALVTMQTAWLKCHYRAEFMAAILTSDADKTDKLVAHISDARESGIEVLPPDVNESGRSFLGVPGKIRFGLGGVKGVGSNAIDAILEVREAKGAEKFKGLYDFCERVDLRRVNKKVIECLVRCGAFDFTGIPRWRLFAAIEKALERGQSSQRDRAIGQSSLFGLLGGGPAEVKSDAPGADGEYPDVDAWTDKEKLTGERETLGFYITGHPLDPYADEIKRFTTHTTAQVITHGKNGEQVRIVGVTSALRARPTKTGKLMGFATIEDLTGSIECICFAGGRRGRPGERQPERTGGFETWQPLLETDAPLLISGTVQMNTRDEENPTAEIIVDDIVPLAEMRARRASRLTITVPAEQVTPDKLTRVKNLLGQHPGSLGVEMRVVVPGASVTKVVVRDCKVTPTDELRERLNLLFGGSVVGVE